MFLLKVVKAGGNYIYRIQVKNETGQIDGKTGKLILMK
jgi:hypothetical protein